MLYWSDKFEELVEDVSSNVFNCQVCAALVKLSTRADMRVTDHVANYLHLEDNGQISYLPTKKINEARGEEWTSRHRQTSRPGRLIRSLVTDVYLLDRDLERFLYTIDALREAKMYRFNIVAGEDIRRYYHKNTYAQSLDIGSLANSCMRYDKCQPYFDLYVENPDKIRMLIVQPQNEDIIVGRALIWNADSGDTLVDRIYGRESTIEAVIQWAQGQGFWHKWYQTFDTPRHWVNPAGDRVTQSFTVTINHALLDYQPYMDTFQYLSMKEFGPSQKGVLTNYHRSRSGEAYIDIQDTDGGVKLSRCQHSNCQALMINVSGPYCSTCDHKERCINCFQRVGQANLDNHLCAACVVLLTCDTCKNASTSVYERYTDSKLRECSVCSSVRCSTPQTCLCGVECPSGSSTTQNRVQPLCDDCLRLKSCHYCHVFVADGAPKHVIVPLIYDWTVTQKLWLDPAGPYATCNSCIGCDLCRSTMYRTYKHTVRITSSDGAVENHDATLCRYCRDDMSNRQLLVR